MSVTSISTSSPRPVERDDDHEGSHGVVANEARAPKEFDFAGAAYAHTTLPTGMIASSTTATARAAVAADWSVVESKLGDVKRDLQSPAMRELFGKAGKATWTMQKVELKVAAAVLLAAAVKNGGIGALLGAGGSLSSLASAADDIADLPRQIHEALGAAHAAHPDAVVLERDLRDLAGALRTLASDAKGVVGF